jgi:hypothetical protein
MIKRLVKGSKAAKDFMAKIRAKKGAVKNTVKRVVKNAKQSFRDGYNAKDKVGNADVESEIKKVLSKLKKDKKYIALSLHPPLGYTTIQKYGNRMFINEGRQGKFNDVSENFYDAIVDKYDSRVGSTLLINKGENPRKKPTRIIQVDRTKKGTFKKFKTISGVSKKHTDTKSHNINIKVGALPSYKDPDAALEIQLYADNDSQLYYQRRKPILINLSKKHKKGQYDIDKAAKLWRYYIDAAMQKYQKEFGGKGSWSNLLSVADRKVLANDYAINTLEEFELGNYTEK